MPGVHLGRAGYRQVGVGVAGVGAGMLAIRRSHAYLLPEGRRLPFRPVGEVFYLN
ncbi:hypothetical protein [Sphaerotilus sp.]|uniref:hypothetical protein n=1 Tax=Sphaerotilus sp. TaxID=2093942 RepID=UPI002ACDD256|nr:hypothetical protein [Sphaerotilus sp.]MDZ7857140.1 hypothetical protein [Sphaerotilus sp.]